MLHQVVSHSEQVFSSEKLLISAAYRMAVRYRAGEQIWHVVNGARTVDLKEALFSMGSVSSPIANAVVGG